MGYKQKVCYCVLSHFSKYGRVVSPAGPYGPFSGRSIRKGFGQSRAQYA